jgi:hypothetical protein
MPNCSINETALIIINAPNIASIAYVSADMTVYLPPVQHIRQEFC